MKWKLKSKEQKVKNKCWNVLIAKSASEQVCRRKVYNRRKATKKSILLVNNLMILCVIYGLLFRANVLKTHTFNYFRYNDG